MINFELLHPKARHEHLGLIPAFFSEADARPAREQVNENYKHGGGWHPFKGFKWDKERGQLRYPGDPPTRVLAKATLRNETIYFFEHSWLLIEQANGEYEISRCD